MATASLSPVITQRPTNRDTQELHTARPAGTKPFLEAPRYPEPHAPSGLVTDTHANPHETQNPLSGCSVLPWLPVHGDPMRAHSIQSWGPSVFHPAHQCLGFFFPLPVPLSILDEDVAWGWATGDHGHGQQCSSESLGAPRVWLKFTRTDTPPVPSGDAWPAFCKASFWKAGFYLGGGVTLSDHS